MSTSSHMELAITPHLPQIGALITEHETSMITAPTGSGKSLAIPDQLAQMGRTVMIVEPTRAAVWSLTSVQRDRLRGASWLPPNTNINEFVGFAKESEVNYNSRSKIIYVTSGHARKKALSCFTAHGVEEWNFCDVLVLDEMHSGTVDNTVIVHLWSIAKASGNKVPRLALITATPIQMQLETTPVLFEVKFRRHEVRKHYSPVPLLTNERKLYAATAKKIAELHRTQPLESLFDQVRYSNHILVFAPGSREVLSLIEDVRTELGTGLTNYKLIPLYGALQEQEIQEAFSQLDSSIRKIIIATNMAEMSITIQDVGIIVDTMLEKRIETSQSGGKRLVTLPISKDSADQRAGRTGRTRPGDCYRMCSEIEYGERKDHRLEEIYRVPIYEIVAELLAAGLNPQWALPGVEEQRINQTIELLRKLGLVTTTDLGDQVTDLGRFASRVQLSVRNATFLWNWWQKGLPLYLGIVMACLVDCYGSYFYIPSKQGARSIAPGQNLATGPATPAAPLPFERYYGADDLETYLNMWQDIVINVTDSEIPEDHFDPNARLLTRYCQAMSLNNRTVSELFRVINHTTKQLRKYQGKPVQSGRFEEAIKLVDAARPILLASYSDHILLKEGKLYYNYTSQKTSVLNQNSALHRKLPAAIISLASHEIGQGISGGNATSSIVDMAIVTTVDEKGQDVQVHKRSQTRGRYSQLTKLTGTATPSVSLTGALADALALLGVDPNPSVIPTSSLSVVTASSQRESPWELLAALPTFPESVDPWQWLVDIEPIRVVPPSQAPVSTTRSQTTSMVGTSAATSSIVNVAREYRRWLMVNKMEGVMDVKLPNKAASTILSSWLIDQALLPDTGSDSDAIFSNNKLSDVLPINYNLMSSFIDLGLSSVDANTLWKNVQLLVSSYLILARDGVQQLPTVHINAEDKLITIGSYRYYFSAEQYDKILKVHPQEKVVEGLLRYASFNYLLITIHPSIAQWLSQSFQITQELATTPFTHHHQRYYSWFPVTDQSLGSAGWWGDASLEGQSSLIILQDIPSMVEHVGNWIKQQLTGRGNQVVNFQLVVVCPTRLASGLLTIPDLVGRASFPIRSLPFTVEQDLIPNSEEYLILIFRRGTWATPLTQVIEAINGYGRQNSYQPIIRTPPQTQNGSELLTREYTRYQVIIVPLRDMITQDWLEAKGKDDPYFGSLVGTTYGLIENWLITLANDAPATQVDPIFSVEAMDPNYPATAKLVQQLGKFRVQYPKIPQLLERMRVLIATYLSNPMAVPPPQIEREGEQLTIGTYTREFPEGRLDILLDKANLVAVAAMTIREACLMPRGRQYTQPLLITKYYVEQCGVNLEGFATPINAQILAVDPNLWFCSLFPDTDGPFGSQGSFFKTKFSRARMTIYPPFVEAVVDQTAVHLASMFDEGEQLFAVITVPDWKDAKYYPILTTSSYCKKTFTIKKNENYSEDLRGKPKLNKVDDLIVIWNKGYPDLDYNAIEKTVLNIHKRGVQKLVKNGAALK